MQRLYSIVLTLIFSFLTVYSQAQFEGHIKLNVYAEEDGETSTNELNLFATSSRILIKGEESIDLISGMSSDGLLIRNDMKDFIVMAGENKALQVTKIEIESMVDMLAGWDNASNADTEESIKTDYSFSDRTQEILGYTAAEMIIRNKEKPENYLAVWLTPDIKINWGMLGERWKNMPKSIDKEVNGMSQQIIFKDRNFPLKVEVVEGNKRTVLMEATNVNESSIAKAMVEVPSGMVLMSFRDFIFQKMMEQ